MGPKGRKCCHVLQRAECLHMAILILNIVFLCVCVVYLDKLGIKMLRNIAVHWLYTEI